MNRRIFISIILLCSLGKAYAQESIFIKNIDWQAYETELDITYRTGEINKIQDDLLSYFKENQSLKQNLVNFHFVDYDFNGVVDILYSGYGGTESMRTLVFELGIDGLYHCTFNMFGELINIFQYSHCLPMSFVLRDIECCGGNHVIYEVYHLDKGIVSSKLNLTAKYSSYRETEIPNK